MQQILDFFVYIYTIGSIDPATIFPNLIFLMFLGVVLCSLPFPAFKKYNHKGRCSAYHPERIALYISLIVLLGTLLLWHYFLVLSMNTSINQDNFILVYEFFKIENLPGDLNLGIFLALDGISMCFILLTAIIFPLCFVANLRTEYNNKINSAFTVFLLIIELLLFLTFSCTDIIFFYIFFESILIPMFMVIGIWGARSRKVKAAFYFFLYTLFGSLVMLFGLIYLVHITGSSNYEVLLATEFTKTQQIVLWGCFFMAFAAKIPMFPFHIWLPEAHVEAPTIGSVILASLLLKLGGYGFLRFSVRLFPLGCEFFMDLVYTLSVISIIYASLSTIRQVDLKRIIAYSSIAHMNLLVLGLFANNQQGIEGAIYLMIAHGVVSSALFFCVGVLYDRYHTRLLKYYGGVVQVMPIFTIIFLVFTLANMGFPGTSNFIGELLVLIGIFQKNTFVLFLAATGIVLSAVYSIWLFNRVCFGTLKIKYINFYSDINSAEFAVFSILVVLMILLGLDSSWLVQLIETPVNSLLYNNVI